GTIEHRIADVHRHNRSRLFATVKHELGAPRMLELPRGSLNGSETVHDRVCGCDRQRRDAFFDCTQTFACLWCLARGCGMVQFLRLHHECMLIAVLRLSLGKLRTVWLLPRIDPRPITATRHRDGQPPAALGQRYIGDAEVLGKVTHRFRPYELI